MIQWIQKKTASSREGAVGLIKGVIACAFQNIAFMLPVSLLYLLVSDLFAVRLHGRVLHRKADGSIQSISLPSVQEEAQTVIRLDSFGWFFWFF